MLLPWCGPLLGALMTDWWWWSDDEEEKEGLAID
jgi:hypothetical protein